MAQRKQKKKEIRKSIRVPESTWKALKEAKTSIYEPIPAVIKRLLSNQNRVG